MSEGYENLNRLFEQSQREAEAVKRESFLTPEGETATPKATITAWIKAEMAYRNAVDEFYG